MAKPRMRIDRVKDPAIVIEAARQAAKTALPQRQPRLTALERGFYEKYSHEQRQTPLRVIQFPQTKNEKQAA